MMNRLFAFLLLGCAASALGQIKVDPATVNVNSQGASTVFLSYGNVRADQFSIEALWCADIISAAPDIGQKCNPASTWGRLPLRNDLARASGAGGFTDIMTIPQNVVRRAYQSASRGAVSSFFYVRRFGSANGQPDEYIAILCRMAGRGAEVPLAITDVKLAFAENKNVLAVPVGQAPSPLYADLTYTGTGRLIGRWEVVMPGMEPPTAVDLLPEASLPVEERATQRRFTQLSRFNVYLRPVGRQRIEGPDVSKLPVAIEGLYQILMRVEASDDGEGNTDLAAVGSGSGIVSTGGVAGFPFPVLRYYVGSAHPDLERAESLRVQLALVAPQEGIAIPRGERVTFEWRTTLSAAFYRLEVIDSSDAVVASAIVEAPSTHYLSPPFEGERQATGKLTWRVTALDREGKEIARSPSGTLHYGVDPSSQVPKE